MTVAGSLAASSLAEAAVPMRVDDLERATPREATGRCDFNGDGFEDIAVGAPFENARQGDRRTIKDVGVVDIAYGRDQIFADGFAKGSTWAYFTDLTTGAMQRASRYGSSFVCADFNNDGQYDLAVGAPFVDIGPAENAGFVGVLYGYPREIAGFTDTLGNCGVIPEAPDCPANQAFAQSFGLDDRPESNDFLGYEMTWGDFDGDGFQDLAVSAPGESVGRTAGAGMVHVLYGSDAGLRSKYTREHRAFTQDSVGGPNERAETGDNFGEFLSAVDLNGDLVVDLAIGVPREDLRGQRDAGILQTMYGSSGQGLTAQGQVTSKASIGKRIGADERFGSSVAFGNFDEQPQYRDLICSAPGEDVNGKEKAGAVYLLPGGPGGIVSNATQRITQASPGIEGQPAANDNFGTALVAGVFDGDADLDLAIGIPNKDIGAKRDAGAVQIISGNGRGLGRRDAIYTLEQPSRGDRFGASLLVGRFDGRFPEVLVIGAPTGDVGRIRDAGFAALLVFGNDGSSAMGTITQPAIARRNRGFGAVRPETKDGWGTFSIPNPAVLTGADLLERSHRLAPTTQAPDATDFTRIGVAPLG